MTSMQLVPFTRLLQRASNLLGFSSGKALSTGHGTPPPIDGEIVYSKNNVCIHQASSGDLRQIPGYFTLRCQSDEVCGTTLVLSWVPNRTIKSNPRSVHGSSPPLLTPESSERCDGGGGATTHGKSPIKGDRLRALLLSKGAASAAASSSDDGRVTTGEALKACATIETGHRVPRTSPSRGVSSVEEAAVAEPIAERPDTQFGRRHHRAVPRPRSLSLTDGDDPLAVPLPPPRETTGHRSALTPSRSANGLMSSSVLSCSDVGGTLGLSSLNVSPPSESATDCLRGNGSIIADKCEVAFHESLQTQGSKKHQLPVFCVDLGLMKSLRLFYSDEECTCGQLVVASRESQYKIFHFYHGGLDKLAEDLLRKSIDFS